MPKQSKAQHFRMLLPVINELEEVYQQEGIVQILKEKHNLELTLTTYRNYLYRYNKEENNENEVNNHLEKTVVNVPDDVQPSNEKSDDFKTKNVESSDDKDIDVDAALERLKRKTKNKGILDK